MERCELDLQRAPAHAPRFAAISNVLGQQHRRRLVRFFGGFDPNFNVVLGDTWEWDGTDWTLAADYGPAARFGATMAFDPARSLCILYSGLSAYQASAVNETLGVGRPSTHSSATSHASGPCCRSTRGTCPGLYGAGMAYDNALARVVVFGGVNHYGTLALRTTIDLRPARGQLFQPNRAPKPLNPRKGDDVCGGRRHGGNWVFDVPMAEERVQHRLWRTDQRVQQPGPGDRTRPTPPIRASTTA